MKLDKRKAENILKEAKRRANPVDLLEDTFPEQRAFIQDVSKLKALLTTRRAGKSTAVGIIMVLMCLITSHTKCAYFSLTRETAGRTMMPVFKKLIRRFKIKAHITNVPLMITFKNGSSIVMQGLNTNEDEREKLLGQHFKIVCIDECASYTIDLKKTIADYIRPTLIDDDGQLIMIGTPGNIQNYFCDITEGRVPGWSNHFWTTHENTTIPDKRNNKTMAVLFQEEIDALKLENPHIEEDPGFQQHYRAKWTTDNSAKVIKIHDRNVIPAMTDINLHPFESVLGIDLGEEDDNAFVISSFRDYDPNLYFPESYSKNHLTMDEIIDKIRTFQRRYDIIHIAIDSANKQYVEELKRRSGINFQTADKPGKLRYIQMLNSDMIAGRIKIVSVSNISLLAEINKVVMDFSDPLKPKIKDGQKDHLIDAFLYAWRASTNYLNSPLIVEPPKTEEEKIEQFWQDESDKLESKKENSRSFLERDWNS